MRRDVEMKLTKGRAFFARVEQSMGRSLEHNIIDLFMDNARELGFNEDDCLMVGNIIRADKGLPTVPKWWTDKPRKTRARLFCNRNGIVCLETRTPHTVTSSMVHDYRVAIEYKCNTGWYTVATYEDHATARQVYRERNRAFKWRCRAIKSDMRATLNEAWQNKTGRY